MDGRATARHLHGKIERAARCLTRSNINPRPLRRGGLGGEGDPEGRGGINCATLHATETCPSNRIPPRLRGGSATALHYKRTLLEVHLVECSHKAHTHGSGGVFCSSQNEMWLNNTWLSCSPCRSTHRVVSGKVVSRVVHPAPASTPSLVFLPRLSVILAEEDVCSHHVLASHGVLLAATHRL